MSWYANIHIIYTHTNLPLQWYKHASRSTVAKETDVTVVGWDDNGGGRCVEATWAPFDCSSADRVGACRRPGWAGMGRRCVRGEFCFQSLTGGFRRLSSGGCPNMLLVPAKKGRKSGPWNPLPCENMHQDREAVAASGWNFSLHELLLLHRRAAVSILQSSQTVKRQLQSLGRGSKKFIYI